MTLWSYGDSHAAGHELGAVSDLGRDWLKTNYGFDSRIEAKEKLGSKYTDIVRTKWYEYLQSIMPENDPRHCTPELSYASVLSCIMGHEFVNRAKPGSSNDYISYLLFADREKWDAEDIIVVSIVTPKRFMPKQDKRIRNHQIHWLPFSVQDTFEKYGPSDESFNLWNQGLVHMMKGIHPNTVILYTTDDDMSVLGFDTTENMRDVPLSLTAFVEENWNEDMRYLGGHFHEDCHKAYGEYIYGVLNDSR